MKLLIICGTRPEAIKMVPIIQQALKDPEINLFVCSTSQHKEMLKQVFDIFSIKVNFDLNIMKNYQTLSDITISVLKKLEDVIVKTKPDIILVQGDTTTTMVGALSGFYSRIFVGHVEAGLRSFQKYAPYPEEINRRITTILTDFHFAPTRKAKENLLRENIDPERIFITGNTGIDALFSVKENIGNSTYEEFMERYSQPENQVISEILNHSEGKKIILVTGHRRENFGKGFISICKALKNAALRNDVEIIYSVHLNPNVQIPIHEYLKNINNIHLLDPLDYLSFVFLMNKSHIVLTDSGGIQEEAPSLGKPVLVTRSVTERPEAVEAGTVKLVGTDDKKIVRELFQLLDDNQTYLRMSLAHNPYGDGKASGRILSILKTQIV